MEIPGHLPTIVFFSANILYCVAYFIRDMLWLRIVTVIAALMTFPYFLSQTEILYSALLWQAAFALINVVNIVRLYYDNRPVNFDENESRMKHLVFPHFNNQQLKRLFQIAQWKSGQRGEKTDSAKPVYQQTLPADGRRG